MICSTGSKFIRYRLRLQIPRNTFDFFVFCLLCVFYSSLCFDHDAFLLKPCADVIVSAARRSIISILGGKLPLPISIIGGARLGCPKVYAYGNSSRSSSRSSRNISKSRRTSSSCVIVVG